MPLVMVMYITILSNEELKLIIILYSLNNDRVKFIMNYLILQEKISHDLTKLKPTSIYVVTYRTIYSGNEIDYLSNTPY